MRPRKAILPSLLILSAACPAWADDAALAVLRTEIAVEQSLLEEDLLELRQVRRQERRAEQRATELAAELDGLLAGDEPLDLQELEDLEFALELSRQSTELAARRAREIRRKLYDRWRRMRALTASLNDRSAERLTTDPVSGRWQVQILPAGQAGAFELALDGTLVSGSYELDGGYRGSLRGTYVGGTLRLERIDADRGFDVVYEGRVDPDRRRVDGVWKATLLSSGGPGGGTWVGVKATPESAE